MSRILCLSLLLLPTLVRAQVPIEWLPGSDTVIAEPWVYQRMFATSDGVIYGIAGNGDLHWHRHTGQLDGSQSWHPSTGTKVGAGWQEYLHVFAGADGIIYSVAQDGTLYWYRHLGYLDGTTSWAEGSGRRVVGSGWDMFRYVVAAEDGVLYGVAHDGRLLWYRRADPMQPVENWMSGSGSQVGSGWHAFERVMAGDGGTLLAIDHHGTLMWYRRPDPLSPQENWVYATGRAIGGNWLADYPLAFTGTQGTVYSLNRWHQLSWYRMRLKSPKALRGQAGFHDRYVLKSLGTRNFVIRDVVGRGHEVFRSSPGASYWEAHPFQFSPKPPGPSPDYRFLEDTLRTHPKFSGAAEVVWASDTAPGFPSWCLRGYGTLTTSPCGAPAAFGFPLTVVHGLGFADPSGAGCYNGVTQTQAGTCAGHYELVVYRPDMAGQVDPQIAATEGQGVAAGLTSHWRLRCDSALGMDDCEVVQVRRRADWTWDLGYRFELYPWPPRFD